MKTWATTFLLLALAWPAEAANCKKGIPCGGSCIARDKICRISQPTTSMPSAKPPAASAAAPAGEPGTQNSADYGDLVPATITCPKGRVLLAGTTPPMCARLGKTTP